MSSPRRFYQGNYRILREVRDFIWGNDRPAEAYDEVRLQTTTSTGDSFSYGSLDWIVVPPDSDSDFDFIGVEIQTDSTTGTGKFKPGLLIDYSKVQSIIKRKIGEYSPKITF